MHHPHSQVLKYTLASRHRRLAKEPGMGLSRASIGHEGPVLTSTVTALKLAYELCVNNCCCDGQGENVAHCDQVTGFERAG